MTNIKPSLERAGRLAAYEAPDLDERRSYEPPSTIARPLGLDPASTPIVDRDRKIRVRSVCKSARHATILRTERSDESTWSQVFLSMTPTARASQNMSDRTLCSTGPLFTCIMISVCTDTLKL